MSVSADQPSDIAHLKDLVLQAEVQARSFGVRDAGGLMDALPALCHKAEFRALQESLTESWQVALSNLDAIAENDMAKTIALCSCWYIPEDDFVTFLSSSALLVEEGKLNRDIFRWCQSPMESQLSGFLARNYADPSVQDVIMRSRKIFQDQPERLEHYDRLLTGESRRKLEQFEAAMREDRTPDSVSDELQEPITQKPIVEDTAQAEPAEEPEDVSTPSAVQAAEDPLRVASVKEHEPKDEKRGFVLPIVVGIVAVLACVGAWAFHRHW